MASLVLICSAGLGSEINGALLDGFVTAQDRRALKPLPGPALCQQQSRDPSAGADDMLKYKRLEGVGEALATVAAANFAQGRQRESLAQVPAALGKPVLAIWGQADQIIPAAHAPAAAGAIRVEVLAGQGHMVQMEAANEVNRLIDHFLG